MTSLKITLINSHNLQPLGFQTRYKILTLHVCTMRKPGKITLCTLTAHHESCDMSAQMNAHQQINLTAFILFKLNFKCLPSLMWYNLFLIKSPHTLSEDVMLLLVYAPGANVMH